MTETKWVDRLAYTSKTEILSDGSIKIKNVRDWTYEGETEVNKGWRSEVIVRPEDVSRMWYMLEHFPYWDGAGHTYLTIDFKDAPSLSFSIEARLKEGQTYSPLEGVFNTYGLAYTWGIERDFLTRRLLFLKRDLYMYPLALNEEIAMNMFKSLADETNNVSDDTLYNTLTANCTNLLIQIMNKTLPKKLPRDSSWQFTGTSDLYLMKHALIKNGGDSKETRRMHNLKPLKEQIATFAQHPDFSARLRTLLKETGAL